MQIQFLGATQTVTGSKYAIRHANRTVLVDCGLFQGHKTLRLRNWQALPVDPATVDAVILTHAHLDHSGYIPLLVKNGFRGKIYSTEATRDLCAVLLPDCGYLQEEEARYANQKGFSKHHPALPLYTHADAERALEYFHPVAFKRSVDLTSDWQFSLHYGGHILGAAFLHLQTSSGSLLFSGDLGRQTDPLFYPPAAPIAADYLIVESTYGNRLHETQDPANLLQSVIQQTAKRGGAVLIPAFAVGRAQSILHTLYQLKSQQRIPNIPIYVDSPMAIDATKLFYHHHPLHRLNRQQTEAVCRVAHYVHDVEDSKTLDHLTMPRIIVSASGMLTGGRVLHHCRHLLPDHRNSVVLCGFQASGTRGERLLNSEPTLKLFGESVPVRASIANIRNLSAHADYQEMLTWLRQLKSAPSKVFVTHGETNAASALATHIETKLSWACEIPEYLASYSLA